MKVCMISFSVSAKNCVGGLQNRFALLYFTGVAKLAFLKRNHNLPFRRFLHIEMYRGCQNTPMQIFRQAKP
jgi:hypothetical protein